MDPITTGVISDLVARGLVSAARRFSRRTSRPEAKILALHEWRSRLPDIVTQAASSVSINVSPPKDIDENQLVTFLKGPEPAAIVGQLFALRISAESDSMREIERAFIATAGLHLGSSHANDAYFGSLFQAIIETTGKALATYVELDSLAARDARTMFQLNLALGELASVKRNITLLTSQQRADVPTILRFERDYRDQVKVRFGFIIPPHIQAAQRIPIDDLFVAPNIARGVRPRRERSDVLGVADFLNAIFRSVLLGNPGGGKSTLAQKLAYGLASSDLSIEGPMPTPMFVTLREYLLRVYSWSMIGTRVFVTGVPGQLSGRYEPGKLGGEASGSDVPRCRIARALQFRGNEAKPTAKGSPATRLRRALSA